MIREMKSLITLLHRQVNSSFPYFILSCLQRLKQEIVSFSATFRHHFYIHPVVNKIIVVLICLSGFLQMLRVEAPRLTPATPSLPPQLPYQFDVLQSSQELLQHFKLFCDWAYRAFLSLKPKVSAVQ